MKQENRELEIIVPSSQTPKVNRETQRQVERLQHHRIVELEAFKIGRR